MFSLDVGRNPKYRVFFLLFFLVTPENCSVKFFKTIDTAEVFLVNQKETCISKYN